MIGKYYMGIDPGQSGGIALVCRDGGDPYVCPFPDTERDILDVIAGHDLRSIDRAYIEKVHSMPKQGVASSFKFGMNYGFLRGLLTAMEIPFDEVTPQRWQRDMGCLTRGDKNVSKAKAQQLYPSLAKMITHKTADALLIATWARNYESGFYGR